MKYTFIIASLLIGGAAIASPAVGDYAAYNETVTVGTQVESGTLEDTLISYDKTADTYQESEKVVTAGQAQENVLTVASKDLVNDAQIVQLLELCAAIGAKNEVFNIQGENVTACAFPVNNSVVGTVWISAVPFGVVKIDTVETATHKHVEVMLTGYKRGQ